MKITLEIPDGTICAFFDFIRASYGGLVMQGHSIKSDELYDGAEIKVEEIKFEEAEAEWNGLSYG